MAVTDELVWLEAFVSKYSDNDADVFKIIDPFTKLAVAMGKMKNFAYTNLTSSKGLKEILFGLRGN